MSTRLFRFARFLPALAVLSIGSLASDRAVAQYGKGHRDWDARVSGAYQFGYRAFYKVLLINESSRDLDFRLHYNDALSRRKTRLIEDSTARTVYGISFGASRVSGFFVTKTGFELPVDRVIYELPEFEGNRGKHRFEIAVFSINDKKFDAALASEKQRQNDLRRIRKERIFPRKRTEEIRPDRELLSRLFDLQKPLEKWVLPQPRKLGTSYEPDRKAADSSFKLPIQ